MSGHTTTEPQGCSTEGKPRSRFLMAAPGTRDRGKDRREDSLGLRKAGPSPRAQTSLLPGGAFSPGVCPPTLLPCDFLGPGPGAGQSEAGPWGLHLPFLSTVPVCDLGGPPGRVQILGTWLASERCLFTLLVLQVPLLTASAHLRPDQGQAGPGLPASPPGPRHLEAVFLAGSKMLTARERMACDRAPGACHTHGQVPHAKGLTSLLQSRDYNPVSAKEEAEAPRRECGDGGAEPRSGSGAWAGNTNQEGEPLLARLPSSVPALRTSTQLLRQRRSLAEQPQAAPTSSGQTRKPCHRKP